MASLSLPTQAVFTLTGHQGPVSVVRFNRDGAYCMSGGHDKTLKLWNPHRGGLIKTYTGSHNHEILDVAIAMDNGRFASVGGDKTVYIWDVSSGKNIRKFTGHDGRINAVKWNSDCTVLVTGSHDTTLRAWDVRSNSFHPMQVIKDFRDSVTSVVVRLDEIIGGSVDGTVRRFDMRAGKVITDSISKPVTCVTVSNDENCILASCLDSCMRLIDKITGELLSEYRGHSNTQYRIDSCFTNTDGHVASGSEDGVIRFWDLVDANVVHTLKGHTRTVSSVVYHPTEHCLVSSSFDGTLKVWK
eukprot:GILJ01012434.1.p1 GENE.GILJ01012434.1~~GILJ01012434.1.p1  ORF type:complete len:300 (+),score=22.48 GILJ01012434.1:74-973(+)